MHARTRISVRIPCVGDVVRNPGIPAIARSAEEVGVDGIWVNDHLVMPNELASRYPFGNGTAWWTSDSPWYEAFTSASWVAASTQRCEVGIATLVLPQRDFITAAKTAATIDVLSGGRFVLGVGAGWLAEEMRALGHDFGSRGKRLEAMIPALRAAWGADQGLLSDPYASLVRDFIFEPKPAQADLPIMVGGTSRAARRRAAELGDGWLCFVSGADYDSTALHHQVLELRELRQTSHRRGQPFRVVATLVTPSEKADQLPEIAAELVEAGFDEIAIDPPWAELERATSIIEATVSAVGTTHHRRIGEQGDRP